MIRGHFIFPDSHPWPRQVSRLVHRDQSLGSHILGGSEVSLCGTKVQPHWDGTQNYPLPRPGSC